MEQMNIGNLFIEMGYGTNTTGKSQYTSNIHSNEIFGKTLNGAKTSMETTNHASKNQNISSKSPFKSQAKEYKKYSNKYIMKDKKIDSNEADSILKEKDKTNSCASDSHILVLLSQNLNLSIDKIQEALEKLGLEIEDLKSQEGFGSFISEICGQEGIIELLTNAGNLKNITTLFEQLSNVQEEQLSNVSEANTQQTSMALDSQGEVADAIVEASKENSTTPTQKADWIEANEKRMGLGIQATDLDEEINETSDQNLNLFQEQQDQGSGLGIAVNHFTTTFTQTFQTEAGVVTQTTTKNMTSGETLIEQIDFKILGQTKEINLQLSPKELGDLNIKIIENNSVLVAEIKVDNDKAKELILSQMHHLKENLESQGLTITEMKVDIRQSHQESQMEQGRQKSSKRIQEIISKQLDTIEEEDVSRQMTSEIDYMV